MIKLLPDSYNMYDKVRGRAVIRHRIEVHVRTQGKDTRREDIKSRILEDRHGVGH